VELEETAKDQMGLSEGREVKEATEEELKAIAEDPSAAKGVRAE